MRALIDDLCSDECAGRRAGSPGGAAARAMVTRSLRAAGLDPFEQEVPACNGANVLASIKGDVNRWVLVAAHYDHLGRDRSGTYRGADDNAAAVAILVEVARGLAQARADGRGVIIAAFDAEEPPHFMTESMGSMHFAHNPIVPLSSIDLMICMDLVGHSLGEGDAIPRGVRDTVFALGAERSAGTLDRIRALSTSEPGVIVRPADAEIIPPLSDHAAFWRAERPFLFLTNGRSRRYHTVDDTADHLDTAKMTATARWLERFVRDTCARSGGAFTFHNARNDVATLDSLIDVLAQLQSASPMAAQALAQARSLRGHCDKRGALPAALADDVDALVSGIETALA
ncbi:MAG TPA: M28 family peptidase [Myxococcota bacterium]|jgi:Zn-dependent M28 family amino/carboxypeptidase